MNQTYRLPIIETVKNSWEKVKGSKATFWAVLIIVIMAQLCVTGIDQLLQPSNNEQAVTSGFIYLGIAVTILLVIFRIILQWGLVYMAVQRAMNLSIRFNMLKYVFNMNLIFRMIGLTVLNFLILLPAIILLFLPTAFSTNNINNIMKLLTSISYLVGAILFVYLFMRLLLAPVLVIMKKTGPWTAIKISFKATKSNVWRLIGLFLLNMIILVLSAIPLGIGLIWSLPYLFISYAMVYKELIISKQNLNI